MRIKQLKINNLRVIESASISPGPALNLIQGHNGAGKTTILESLAILSRGRSFRSGSVSSQVGPNGEAYTLVCEIERDDGQRHRLGIERSRTEWRARCDGKDVAQLTDLSARMPVVSMHPENYTLVSGPPETRRRYLDWGVFHVKPGFLEDWRRYARALSQRNAALRQHSATRVIESITPQLAESAETLSAMRQEEADLLAQRLAPILDQLSTTLPEIELGFQPGWSGTDFSQALGERLDLDRERGWTSIGPQRAELVFRANGKLARDTLSRGEQKILYVALNLAQAERLAESGHRPVLLIDDLASEFDGDHLHRVIERCLSMGLQTIVTGTDVSAFSEPQREGAMMFHVEHGQVR